MEQQYARMVQNVETVVLDRHDIIGEDASKFSGRGEPLQFVIRPVLIQGISIFLV